jgi:hypothetical protein
MADPRLIRVTIIKAAALRERARLLVRDACRLVVEAEALRRRVTRCAACHGSLKAADATVSGGYVPASNARSGGSTRVHLRCLVRWITACLRSDPGRAMSGSHAPPRRGEAVDASGARPHATLFP